MPPLVIQMAASVTPCRHHAGPTVLDKHRQPCACGSAASLGGDIAGTDQIPVPLKPAVGTAESAALGLGDPPLAGGTGGGGTSLIHHPHHHPCPLGLVAQCLQQVGAAPLLQPPVLHRTRILVCDPLRVAHQQGPDALLDGEGDDLLGGPMLGLVDAAAMAALHAPQAGSVASPAPRAALSRLGMAAGGVGLACLLILTVQVALGADGSPGHQQSHVLRHHGIRMDDPQIHPGDLPRVQVMLLDGDGSGDRQPQPSPIG
jgi:hypothetical protein